MHRLALAEAILSIALNSDEEDTDRPNSASGSLRIESVLSLATKIAVSRIGRCRPAKSGHNQHPENTTRSTPAMSFAQAHLHDPEPPARTVRVSLTSISLSERPYSSPIHNGKSKVKMFRNASRETHYKRTYNVQ
jgi:hypothetical protein